MGVWVDHRFAWCDGDGWSRLLSYEPGTMVGRFTFVHEGLRVKIEGEEAADPVDPAFVRSMRVTNMDDRAHAVRLFFSHDLRINETDIGDTALYHPQTDSLIHYKGPYAFLFSGRVGDRGIFEFTTGIKAFGDQVGSWVDAEDGTLGGNPITQGSVDSTFSLELMLEAGETQAAEYWMVCGPTLDDAVERAALWIGKDPGRTIRKARAYWSSWRSRFEDHGELTGEFQEFYDRSLFLIRSQIDNGGAILAANDSDIMATNRATYSFLWPRDGALVAQVLDVAGHPEISHRYFDLCHRILPTDRPMFLHKYGPDGSLGASWHPFMADGEPEVPFQEDESALTVWALAEHYREAGDIERIARWYPRLVREICDYMVEFRDPATQLPLPSWDLWEERRGIHAYTCATVVAGLDAGALLADALGEDASASRWRLAADEVRQAVRSRLFNAEKGGFYRMLRADGNPDHAVDAATLSFGLFGVFPADDPMVLANAELVERLLSIKSSVGGIGRYEGDYYFRKTDAYPGNPWVICTMWLAQQKMLAAKPREELQPGLEALRWAMGLAETTGVLAEQYHPETGEPLSVSPLTWSHAEVARTVQTYVRRQCELK